MEQPKKSNKTKFVSLLLIATIVTSIIAVYGFTQINLSIENQIKDAFVDDIGRIDVGYKIECIDGETGEIKQTVCKDGDDIPTQNFQKMIKRICFYDFDSNGIISESFTMTSGSSTGPTLRHPSSCSYFDTGDVDNGGGWIAIGNGTATPSFSDYALDTEVNTYYTTSSTYSTPNVTVTATVQVPYDQGVGISEAGLIMAFAYTSTRQYVMMFRDTFTPVAANQGDAIVVTYYIQLGGTSLTDNFGEFLAGMFYRAREDTSPTFSMIDIAGASSNFNLWRADGQYNLLSTGSGSNDNVGVRIGTGTDAEGHGNYTLGNDVTGTLKGFDTSPIVNTVGNNWNITNSASFQLASSYSITEACVNIKFRNTVGTYKEVMFWRDTFSSYSYTAYDWINVAMRFMY